MAIDTSKSVDAGFLLRWMSVEKMKDLLEQVPPGSRLFPNMVGNISVFQDDRCVGFIDFNGETYEQFTEEPCLDEKS